MQVESVPPVNAMTDTRRPVEGTIKEKTIRPAPRLRRLILWLLETDAGRAVIGVPMMLIISIPVFLWKWWGVAILAALAVGFLLGWEMARRHWTRQGLVPKL